MGRYLQDRELKSSSYAIRLPVGATSLRPTAPVAGQIRYNPDLTNINGTTVGGIEAYFNNKWNTIAKEGSTNIIKDQFVGAGGGSRTFTMSYSYTSGQETSAMVFIGGVYQNPTNAYQFNGTTTITFTSAPPLGQIILVLHNLASTTVV